MQSASSKKDDHLRVEFNEWAEAGRGEGMEKGHGPVGTQAIDRMQLPEDARILDVGCGSGWASRLMGQKASQGRVIGIDISDKMIELARQTTSLPNVTFEVASAESLPFKSNEFSHVFSMESLYYYSNMIAALREINRVLENGGVFTTVIDLYLENTPSHQWIPQLNVPVHLLGIPEYRNMLDETGFVNIKDERLFDPTPVPENYDSGSFNSREDLVQYRANGSLMLSAEVRK